MKEKKNFRLTDEAVAGLVAAAKKNGVSQTAIVELAIREYVKKHFIK